MKFCLPLGSFFPRNIKHKWGHKGSMCAIEQWKQEEALFSPVDGGTTGITMETTLFPGWHSKCFSLPTGLQTISNQQSFC